jgi:hypothetical protein
MSSKKNYAKPSLKTHAVQLGVFGNYGGGNGTPGGDDPRPPKFDNPYNFVIE